MIRVKLNGFTHKMINARNKKHCRLKCQNHRYNCRGCKYRGSIVYKFKTIEQKNKFLLKNELIASDIEWVDWGDSDGPTRRWDKEQKCPICGQIVTTLIDSGKIPPHKKGDPLCKYGFYLGIS